MNLNTTSNDFVDNIHLVDDTLRKKFRNLEKQLKKQINIKWSIAYLDICIKENTYIYIYIYIYVYMIHASARPLITSCKAMGNN